MRLPYRVCIQLNREDTAVAILPASCMRQKPQTDARRGRVNHLGLVDTYLELMMPAQKLIIGTYDQQATQVTVPHLRHPSHALLTT